MYTILSVNTQLRQGTYAVTPSIKTTNPAPTRSRNRTIWLRQQLTSSRDLRRYTLYKDYRSCAHTVPNSHHLAAV